jgi:hypothetical protein
MTWGFTLSSVFSAAVGFEVKVVVSTYVSFSMILGSGLLTGRMILR